MKQSTKPVSSLSSESHLTTSPFVMLILVISGILFSLFGLLPPALFCLISAAVAAVAYFWALHVLDDVQIKITPDRDELFPGDRCQLRISVENQKWVPVIWLSIHFPLSFSSPVLPEPQECVQLPNGPERVKLSYEKNISYLLGHQGITYSSSFYAQHRGIYRIDAVQLISGDGFSLCVRECVQPLRRPIELVVFPQLVPVSTQWFQKHSWEVENGARGLQDDKTVIRNVRAYQPGDSARSLNFRLMAKGLGPVVNVYEKISPRRAAFLLDGISFQDLPPEAFEKSLEILASLLTQLSSEHVTVSLLTSRSKARDSVFETASNTQNLKKLLTLLATAEPDASLTASSILRYLPRLSNTFCICGNCDRLHPDTVSLFAAHRIPLLAWEPKEHAQLHTKPLRSFQTGGEK